MAEALTLTPAMEQRLMQAIERMPAFPKSVQKVLELTRNIDCPPKEVVAVVEKDPVLTLKILRVINSAYYSLPQKITSVAQAVIHLGINTVKNLALSFAAIGMLPAANVAGFDTQRYLLHSLTTATLARLLCQRFASAETDANDCYIAGLLHDFGKVVLAQFMAPEFCQAMTLTAEHGQPLHEMERQVIGADHATVGALLIQKWQFPQSLIDCIRNHHHPQGQPSAMLDCLRVADQISRLHRLGDAGNPWFEDEAPAAPWRFGDDLAATAARLGDLDKIAADAQAFVAARQ